MSKKNKIRIAICYDFDGTLSPGNMQEYDYIPKLGLKTKEFWGKVKKRTMEQEADEILAYMRLMIEKATPESKVKITREAFQKYGETVKLFEGVECWFRRINSFGKENNVIIEHYIISSGIKEMIEGTSISGEFKKIYASSFMYDQNGVAYWPSIAINYTTKTQFLFRINKGILDVWNNSGINAYTQKEKRPIPFSRMIYIGDGSTDIPCMKLVKDQGGYSIAVYKPKSRKLKTADSLLNEDRVNFVAGADYSDGSRLDLQIKAVIKKIVAENIVKKGPRLLLGKARLKLKPKSKR